MGWKNQRLWGSPGGSPMQLPSNPIISTKLRISAIHIRRFFFSPWKWDTSSDSEIWYWLLLQNLKWSLQSVFQAHPLSPSLRRDRKPRNVRWKWVRWAVFWCLGTLPKHSSELPGSLLSESPQLSTSTLDLLTELCLASFKEVPLFKQFFIAGWLWERGRLSLK